MSPSPHFALSEFACKDGTAYPAAWVSSRLRPLCEVLEVVRADIGKPITIVSAYRSPNYNRAIGSKDTSQHPQGRAADIKAAGMTAAKLHAAVLALYREGKLPALGGLGIYKTFVHVDVRPSTGRLARWSGSRASNVA